MTTAKPDAVKVYVVFRGLAFTWYVIRSTPAVTDLLTIIPTTISPCVEFMEMRVRTWKWVCTSDTCQIRLNHTLLLAIKGGWGGSVTYSIQYVYRFFTVNYMTTWQYSRWSLQGKRLTYACVKTQMHFLIQLRLNAPWVWCSECLWGSSVETLEHHCFTHPVGTWRLITCHLFTPIIKTVFLSVLMCVCFRLALPIFNEGRVNSCCGKDFVGKNKKNRSANSG